ncbi:DNA-binding storekeeper protein-relatedtranscriptional regulator [Heracleum sosnowskyi]|uniref:DNA-binding storekeeper protein-relatedtranscriptional regulator n=1 Tax=Heracleum sosnowskyi TaxID=360622 RepID=A0AAD8ITU7_9APIA|nr:DNA-binding storekeeper protein-relatedtranscriptional regulator [Heracleum sosnowskyi]
MSISDSAAKEKEMDGDTESTNSLVERGAGRNKRKWTEDEDEKLVEALLELVNTGNFKADNGFKPGYLTFLENSLQIKLPKAGLKGRPHIESRMKTLKKDFTAVYDIRYGANSSGFGRNSEEHVVTAPRDVWVQYLKLNGRIPLCHASKSFLLFLEKIEQLEIWLKILKTW